MLTGEEQIAEVGASWALRAIANVLDAVLTGEGQTASDVDVLVIGEGRSSRCAHGEHKLSAFLFPAQFLCVDSRQIWQVKLFPVLLGVSQG